MLLARTFCELQSAALQHYKYSYSIFVPVYNPWYLLIFYIIYYFMLYCSRIQSLVPAVE